VGATTADRSALQTWEQRAVELRDRRDRVAARLATHDSDWRAAEERRARADATATMAEERLRRADADLLALGIDEAALIGERDELRLRMATSTADETTAKAALAGLLAEDAADRSRLAEADRAASVAREHLRAADDRRRAADHTELEARLGLDALRDGLLVELSGLGSLAWTSLGMTAPAGSAVRDDDDTDDGVSADAAALEAALAVAAERWAAEPPTAPAPAPGRLAQLRRRYHDLGAVNPFAVDEYAELRTRVDTLETQDADLRSAITRTRELMAELDTMISDQFRKTFAALETAFERRFEQLFGGGYARLSLTDPSDLGSTGVEIVARPPGKKQQALAMLSGGERALTAVALLFAMLEVRPVPFCVLDEVDAALDEANIGRFADALRSLAHQTQFIVITHNRGTIEAADALYGVTVGDDSVSRVISLRLDEAQALASDRQRELSAAG
jgi:chromosome segregation protein